MKWTSEALEQGLKPKEGLSEEELEEFRNSIDADMMGFSGVEIQD